MTDIARLKIALDEVEPPVLRCIEVPIAIRLDQLHLVFQAAMGWQNCHLYEFRSGRGVAFGLPDPNWLEGRTRSAKTANLGGLLGIAGKAFAYVYDFGDDWTHTVKVEAIVPALVDTLYPRLISAEGRCPPEDVGGWPGYEEFLEAMADSKHERHEELMDWHGGMFDPSRVDQAAIAKEIEHIAKRVARKKMGSKRKPESADRS